MAPFITDTGFSEKMLLPPGRSGGVSWLACVVRQPPASQRVVGLWDR